MTHVAKMTHRLDIVVLLILIFPMVVHAQTNNGQDTQIMLKRWSFTATATLYDGGLSEEIIKSMRASGFDDPTTRWLFGSGTIKHPQSYPALTSSITLCYRYSNRLAIRLFTGTAGAGSIHGYNGDVGKYIFLKESHSTTALIPSLIAGEVARIGIGPALHKLEVQREDASGGPGFRKTRIGFVLEAGLTFPARTRWFFDIAFHYRYAGSAEVGPFTTNGWGGGSASIPRTRINFNKTVVSAGIGIRF
ncbi:MAG: hypothetical protein KAT18_07540 [Candidatus Latescibacteria bacterium]|nr:hypothetical protein [Candidatus Latescibacterota bacterium]